MSMPYNPALDGVRALSILAVVLFHCELPGAQGGFIGLDVFFVLSGYLITSLLAAEHRHGGIGIGRFYARRALRLYPTLLLMVAVYVGLAPILWPADDRWLSAVLAALYVYDYALAFWKLAYTIGHTWSLGVEEKFYLLWPILLPLFLRTRHPVRWLVSAFLAVTTWRYFVAMHWTWPQAYFRFDTRMSGILLGAIAALVHVRVSKHALAAACMALLVLMALPSLPTSNQTEAVTLSITLAELSAFVLICYAAEHGRATFLASPPMVYIGRLSYGIYLWHFPLVLLLRDTQPLWITLSGTFAFSFTMAAICLHLVDMPLKRWRRRAWPEAHGTA
ncbi:MULTISPECIES: acyltransferase family protein [Variovorax]|uniref:acyltransferase family protein n=1 Tax=Variovorax TaxID=34072 RepID=UPI00286630A5|nr:acyltransferase [Variovorax sp. 3319]MDR6890339.1 peptidoglycan/LPS O-acetylase OafA/YrhL [Variovorax sp. 3319]